MLAPALADLVASPHSLAFRLFRTLVLCLIGAQFIFSGVTRKSFHWRMGGPMPTWLGRVVLIAFGLFFLGSTFLFWNK